MNYQDAQNIFSEARRYKGVKRKKIDRNTYLYKTDDTFQVKLHDTIIVTIYPDNTCTLNSGGWFTPVTKERINNYSPKEVRLSQRNKVWYLNDGSEFFDGIIIAENGTPINPMSVKDTTKLDKKRKKLDKMVSKYIKEFCFNIRSGNFNYPSAGDCFDCSMVTEDGQVLGDIGNGHHLILHMKDKYYVPSLLYNAFKESHQNPDFVLQYTIEFKSDWNAKNSLKKYFRQRYNKLLELI